MKNIPFLHALCGLLMLPLMLVAEARAADKTGKEKTEASNGKYGGYGRNATGGAGKPTVEVGTFAELKDALLKGNATILLTADIDVPKEGPADLIDSKASNLTLDGQGHTIWGDAMPQPAEGEDGDRGTRHILMFNGAKNIILKNFHIRNAGRGGNICINKGTSDVVIDHVSSTGCTNKAIAVSNKAHDVTVTHCFIAGSTRACFVKYDANRVTIDHTIMMKYWIRAPLIVDCKEFDLRNNLIQEWAQRGFGTGIQGKNSNGNIMGNIYRVDAKSPRPDASIIFFNGDPGKVFVKDNAFKDAAKSRIKGTGTTDRPQDSPPIVPAYTSDMDRLEKVLLSDTEGAGCMPRDAADKAYIAAKTWVVSYGTPFRPNEAKRNADSKK